MIPRPSKNALKRRITACFKTESQPRPEPIASAQGPCQNAASKSQQPWVSFLRCHLVSLGVSETDNRNSHQKQLRNVHILFSLRSTFRRTAGTLGHGSGCHMAHPLWIHHGSEHAWLSRLSKSCFFLKSMPACYNCGNTFNGHSTYNRLPRLC